MLYELTSVEVASVDALLEIEDALVILHQAAQFLSQLQGHVLQGGGLGAVHYHRLCGLVERCLLGGGWKTTQMKMNICTNMSH